MKLLTIFYCTNPVLIELYQKSQNVEDVNEMYTQAGYD